MKEYISRDLRGPAIRGPERPLYCIRAGGARANQVLHAPTGSSGVSKDTPSHYWGASPQTPHTLRGTGDFPPVPPISFNNYYFKEIIIKRASACLLSLHSEEKGKGRP